MFFSVFKFRCVNILCHAVIASPSNYKTIYPLTSWPPDSSAWSVDSASASKASEKAACRARGSSASISFSLSESRSKVPNDCSNNWHYISKYKSDESVFANPISHFSHTWIEERVVTVNWMWIWMHRRQEVVWIVYEIKSVKTMFFLIFF